MRMNSKSADSNSVDLQTASDLLEQLGPAAMYDYSEKFGDRYARLANGVAKGNSTAGNAALRHMQGVAIANGKPLTQDQVNRIRFDMAKAYLDLLLQHRRLGISRSEPTWEEARQFYKQVFNGHNLPSQVSLPGSTLTLVCMK